ncbi:uncharacterized protein LOC119613886 [Lucilia sericata]|uniref:uncharacterized protein LOC119613885 n=1 Tax=Lucilia sericata TaxID=13632 RepID=UPI0018A80C3F|nr:uncharacterized protein LOC119613885 [Lucilia sericata]XP_037825884.1 uncharacterized protein LOC119613886 [Lucilia sericata]
MSEIKDEDCQLKYIPNATMITNSSLDSFPNVKHFFEILVKDKEFVSKHVGRSFRYDNDVEYNRYYSYYGLFMEYFIRKHLSNQFNIEITNRRTEHILEHPDDYIIGKNLTLRDSIKENYEIFKDSHTKAMDIIESIKIVSLSHVIFFREPLPKREYTVNEDNLREIIRYLERLPYKSVDLNPSLGCDYFNADAKLIFDNEVIFEIKTSKLNSLTPEQKKLPLSKFYQPIIYGFGFYKKTGIKVRKFKIYNPLLGDEFSIDLDNIDFELFEKVLKRDVTVFSRLHEILNEKMRLDLTLFCDEDDGK